MGDVVRIEISGGAIPDEEDCTEFGSEFVSDNRRVGELLVRVRVAVVSIADAPPLGNAKSSRKKNKQTMDGIVDSKPQKNTNVNVCWPQLLSVAKNKQMATIGPLMLAICNNTNFLVL